MPRPSETVEKLAAVVGSRYGRGPAWGIPSEVRALLRAAMRQHDEVYCSCADDRHEHGTGKRCARGRVSLEMRRAIVALLGGKE